MLPFGGKSGPVFSVAMKFDQKHDMSKILALRHVFEIFCVWIPSVAWNFLCSHLTLDSNHEITNDNESLFPSFQKSLFARHANLCLASVPPYGNKSRVGTKNDPYCHTFCLVHSDFF